MSRCTCIQKIFGRRGENHLNRNGQCQMVINKNEWITSLSFFIQFQMKNEPQLAQQHQLMLDHHSQQNIASYKKEGEDAQAMIDQNLWLIDSEPHTYTLSEIIRNTLKQQYVIIPQLLLGTLITELKRATLRFWIYQVGSSVKMDRLIVASANYLIDMYFSQGGSVQLQRFQAFGIAALLLANKTLSSDSVLQVNPFQYNHNLLNHFQQKLCRVCKFRLNPITYVHILNDLMHLWNIFAQKHSDLWKYKCSDKGNTQKYKFFNAEQIYQLLDTIFLVIKSFQYSMLDICMYAFKSFLLMDYKVISDIPKPIEDQVIISFWCNPQDQPLMGSSFSSIFQHFLQFVEKSCEVAPNLHQRFNNNEVQQYVQMFSCLLLGKNTKRSIITEQLLTFSQTFNKESWKVAKKFIVLKKNNRKQSIETLQN